MDHQNEEHTDTDTSTEEEEEEEFFQITRAPLTCASVAPLMLKQSWESYVEPKLEEFVTFEWTVLNFQLLQGSRQSPNFYAFGHPFNFELQFGTYAECCPDIHLPVFLYSDDAELLRPSDFEIYVQNSKMPNALMLSPVEFERTSESLILFVGFIHYNDVKDCDHISVMFQAKQDILKERLTGAAISKDEKREIDDANELELASKDDDSSKRSMELLWSSREYLSDLTIQCDGELFQVHKSVLSAGSRAFHALFWLASRNKVRCDYLMYDDVKGRDLQAYLRFLYTGELPTAGGDQLGSTAVAQLRLATRFDTPRLEERCRGYLQACVNRAADSIMTEKWYGYCWMALSDMRYGIDDHPSLL